MKVWLNIKGILGLLVVIMLLTYVTIGDNNIPFWKSFYFISIDLIILWLSYNTLNTNNKLIKITSSVLLLIFSFYFIADLYSFVKPLIFRVINNSYLIGGFILLIVIIFIGYELVKRKI